LASSGVVTSIEFSDITTNPELPLEELAIRFWNAVLPELSAVEFVEVEAPAQSESEAAIVGEDR
jgi:hypothetical protein